MRYKTINIKLIAVCYWTAFFILTKVLDEKWIINPKKISKMDIYVKMVLWIQNFCAFLK